MSAWKKLLATSAAAGGGLNIEDVFSTTLYQTNFNQITVTTGIDGTGDAKVLYWAKPRVDASADDHALVDNVRQTSSPFKRLTSNNTDEEKQSETGLSSFTSTGFTAGQANYFNGNLQGSNSGGGVDEVVWGFKAAPKFFDVVTYTGTGSAQNISHDLGSVPGTVIVKKTSSSANWIVYHRSLGNDKAVFLNLTSSQSSSTTYWNATTPTDSVFSVGANSNTNGNGDTFVAYLFAHNDGDGDFGPTGDQDIIKCGSYTGNGSTTGPEVDLGFEPQWIMIKRTDSTGGWRMLDVMRGITDSGSQELSAQDTAVESGAGNHRVYANGYQPLLTGAAYNASGGNYIYIAIRRGPMAVPTDATDVFDIDTRTGSLPSYVSTFPVDMALRKLQSISANWTIGSRLTGTGQLETANTNAEGTDTDWAWDYMEGYGDDPNVAYALYSWMWKRAPNYFDVVAYDGADVPQTVSHNLGVAPEMMWVKRRNAAWDWYVYHKDLDATNPSHKYLKLNDTAAVADWDGAWNDTDPTSSVFSVGEGSNPTNVSGGTYIAYLFASLDGVSKVGSYTGNGSSTARTIDCGFSSGARFVLIKRTDTTGNWVLFDTERGITSGDDKLLQLNKTNAEGAGQYIDPVSSGFATRTTDGDVNASGGTYIFYAIA